MRILFFGDSITQGFWDTKGGWVGRLREHFDALAMQNLQHNTQPEIFNLGVSGDTTRDLLTRIESETKVRRWENDPLMAVIAIGTNDSSLLDKFKVNLEQIVAIIRPLTETVVLVGNPACDETRTTPVFWGDYSYNNQDLERSEQIIATVAKEHGLPYVPVFQKFKQELDAGNDLLQDGLHPNAEGHQLIADLCKPVLEGCL